MQPIFQTFHPNTLFETHRRIKRPGYTRRKRCVHLQRGRLHQDSGAYCVWTALVILGVLSEQDVMDVRSTLRSRLGSAWHKSTGLLLNGADHWQMDTLLGSLSHFITYTKLRGGNSRVAEFAADKLQLSQLVLLYYVEHTSQATDWLLMVGIEEIFSPHKDEWQLSALLCLDPNQAGSSLVPFNAKIERDLTRKATMRLDYVAHSKRTRVQLLCAFALQPTSDRSQAWLQFDHPAGEGSEPGHPQSE